MDIHSGGVDLAFPHHDNEMAQSEVNDVKTETAVEPVPDARIPGLPQLPSVGKLLHPYRAFAHRGPKNEQVVEEFHHN